MPTFHLSPDLPPVSRLCFGPTSTPSLSLSTSLSLPLVDLRWLTARVRARFVQGR